VAATNHFEIERNFATELSEGGTMALGTTFLPCRTIN